MTEDITLTFDEPDLFPTEGATIDNQYSDYAVFSSDNGTVTMYNSSSSFVQSGNAMWSTGNLTIDFTSPVTAMDTASESKAADINIYVGESIDATYELMGEGTPEVPFLVDLSSYGSIDKLELIVTDLSGLTYDTFSFTITL